MAATVARLFSRPGQGQGQGQGQGSAASSPSFRAPRAVAVEPVDASLRTGDSPRPTPSSPAYASAAPFLGTQVLLVDPSSRQPGPIQSLTPASPSLPHCPACQVLLVDESRRALRKTAAALAALGCDVAAARDARAALAHLTTQVAARR